MTTDEKPEMATVTISASVPGDLLADFIQCVRDFDATHEGCQMEITAMTDQGIQQIEEWLSKLNPPFRYRKTFRKQ